MTPELFDLVALGGSASTRARFDLAMVGDRDFTIPPGGLLLVTHRSDWDIPLTTNLYWPARLWRRGRKPIFVARDDMFLPGFLAGYPPGLPLPLRRLLAPLRVGGVLRRQRLALPIASASRAHLADVVLDDPALPIDALPAEVVDAFRARARRLGRPEPRVGADVADGGYVDLLWRRCERAELPGLDGFWGRRQAVARRDFETIVEHVAGGGSLVLYPEGRPSPDGAVGPLMRGLGLLLRRVAARELRPIGLAYDPLGRGRTRAYVSVGRPFEAPGKEAEDAVLAALRRTLPLTPGQLAAHASLAGVDPELLAATELDRAAADGRPVVPRLPELLPAAVEAARTAPRPQLERLDAEFRSCRAL